jgi:hypothetical protein
MGVVLAESESDGKHLVDQFDHKVVFRNAEGAGGNLVSIPVYGAEG